MKKLLDLERDTLIGVKHLGITYTNGKPIERITFHHIDGMYSYCTDKDGNVVNLNACTEVEDLGNICK